MPLPRTSASIDDLDYLARSGINQNHVVVHDRVAVARGNSKGWRHCVVSDSVRRQDDSDLRFYGRNIDRAVLADHVFAKARNCSHAEQAADRSNGAANRSANDTAHWSANRTAFFGAALRTPGYPLSLGGESEGEQSREHGYSKLISHRHFSVLSTIGCQTI